MHCKSFTHLHESRAIGSRFREIGNHAHCRIRPGTVLLSASRDQTPDCSVTVLVLAWEEIKVHVPKEVAILAILVVPDSIGFGVCFVSIVL